MTNETAIEMSIQFRLEVLGTAWINVGGGNREPGIVMSFIKQNVWRFPVQRWIWDFIQPLSKYKDKVIYNCEYT
jgi:hypothetical protein